MLNKLKPEYLYRDMGESGAQRVRYLDIRGSAAMEDLCSDIAQGAGQFEELRKLAQDNPYHTVLIACDNEEEGLMAVSYLAGIYNEKEGYGIRGMKNADVDAADIEESDIEEEDFGICDESPYRIPVLSSDILYGHEELIQPYYRGQNTCAGMDMHQNAIPYWKHLECEPICIVDHYADEGGRALRLLISMNRYRNNRHIYLVCVHSKQEQCGGFCTKEDYQHMKKAYGAVLLEYAAAFLSVQREEKDLSRYHENLFCEWLERFHKKTAEAFPTAKVVRQIEAISGKNPYSRMEKAVRYVTGYADQAGKTVLEEKDFEVLRKFSSLLHSNTENGKAYYDLHKLYGMEDVKRELEGIVSVLKYQKLRERRGLGKMICHNAFLFLGAPGTAKTTAAKLLGKRMAEEKLLPSGRFISINGAQLKGKFVGQTAPKVHKLFEDYDIILIDEAYSLAEETGGMLDSFSQEAIAQLLLELEQHGKDHLVMFAGYGGTDVSGKDNRMKRFLDANPGLRSRIGKTIHFPSYSAKEMAGIFYHLAAEKKYSLPEQAEVLLKRYFEERVKASDFGNGREARSLLEQTESYAAERIGAEMLTNAAEADDADLERLELSDLEQAIRYMQQSHNQQRGKISRCGFAA